MVGYRAGGLLRLLFFFVVFGIVAAVAYQLGVSQATSAVVVGGSGAAGTVAVPVYVGHVGWGFGFGFLWFLFPLFFIFLIAFALRPRGWHGHRGWGPGPYGSGGPGAPDGATDGGQAGGQAGFRDARRRAYEDFHRQLHEADAARVSTQAPGAAGTPPTDPARGTGSSSGPKPTA
ncbi:MAG: hypothetical protein ACHQ3P_04930 [Candidatus Limnocylindrales bacterium]